MARVFVFGTKNYDIDQYFIGKNGRYKTLTLFIKSEGELTHEDIFISEYHSYPFSVRLEYPSIPPDALVVTEQNIDMDHIYDYKIYDYSFFSGDVVTYHKEEINNHMKDLYNVMFEFVKAGYLVRENRNKIPDWIITFYDPIQKLFILYNNIKTSSEDITIVEEFLVNPQFRELITTTLLKIITNYLVNNKNISIMNWLDENVIYSLSDFF